MKITQLVNKQNKKILFTPGPSSLALENIIGLKPCFGRNDKDYNNLEKFVDKKILSFSKKKKLIKMQGSGSFAIEIMLANYLYGKVLVINSGYYSERIIALIKYYKKYYKNIKAFDVVDWKKYKNVTKSFDWVVFCFVETSEAIRLPLEEIHHFFKKTKTKIMLDATASYGLEKNHHLADVMSFSSCKGLFGLTGACFIASNYFPKSNLSFNLNINNFIKKKMTGPYHSICSLSYILKNYNNFKKSVIENKKKALKIFSNHLVLNKKYQPLICTQLKKKIKTKNKKVILYKPRSNIKGSIICHLGEVHLKEKAKGEILNNIILKK